MTMTADDLTDAERQFFGGLPAPPATAEIRATNVWIIEWLPVNELKTGRLLHEWVKAWRAGWSAYYSCANKAQVVQAIERATTCAQRSDIAPVLHLEAHGGGVGIGLPDGSEVLTWDELTGPLQQLNLATGCNLVVVVAACTGFAGVQALRRGPRAPAMALVGPDAAVMPRDLLSAATAFYRRWAGTNPNLQDIAVAASQEARTVMFEVEPFALLFYEALVEWLIVSLRPAERSRRAQEVRERLLADGSLSASEIDRRVASIAPARSSTKLQQVWDEMFMINIYPQNRERFGLDMKAVVEQIIESHDRWAQSRPDRPTTRSTDKR
jgi:hypothetical protein